MFTTSPAVQIETDQHYAAYLGKDNQKLLYHGSWPQKYAAA